MFNKILLTAAVVAVSLICATSLASPDKDLYLEQATSLADSGRFMAIVDYSRPIFSDRFFIVDKHKREVVFSSKVGHAFRSGLVRPTRTSNKVNSNKTSTGLYRIGKFYHGKFGKSVRLHGISRDNSNAFRRAIVVHKAGYGKYGALWSNGCFTFFQSDYKKVLSFLAKTKYMKVIK